MIQIAIVEDEEIYVKQLTDVHLTAPHIPGGEQPGHKPLTVVHHAGFEGKSVL